MAASAVYKAQAKVAGIYRGGQPHCKVAGHYYNPKAVYVKVAGHWRLTYEKFTWYYWWDVGAWSGCTCVQGYCNTRSVVCRFNPENYIVNDSYCDAGSKPSTTDYCQCNCACACCCC